MTKISWMGRLPHFLGYGAKLVWSSSLTCKFVKMSEKNNFKNIEINSLILPIFGCKVQAAVFTRKNFFYANKFLRRRKTFLDQNNSLANIHKESFQS